MAETISEPHYSGKLRVRISGICLQEGKILLLRHKPFTHNTAGLWSPPGGGLQFGESMHVGLQREFREETGLEIKVGNFLFMNEYIQPPLHALEVFFEVKITGGTLISGYDPELGYNNQLITYIAFKTLPEIKQIPENQLHSCLHQLQRLEDLFEYSFKSNVS